ncbi:MAG: FAD-dependent oxidoreductase [Clostridia bacterium]|nr:FAD-dependent oxidoreductase [Clostridia bacterium]
MRSIFAASCDMPRFEALQEDTKADVLVIGGGIAGILTAALLKEAGVDVLLLEAERLCSGQTGNTTAKITVGHSFIYADILKRYGKDVARGFYEANLAALEKYRDMVTKTDCNFENKDFYAYAKQGHRALGKELAALTAIGARTRFEQDLHLPFETAGAICYPDQAQFHPLRFLAALSKGLRIHENTPVMALFEDGAITCDGKRIAAKSTVVATHYPFLRFRGGFPLKLYQSRSYVLGLTGVKMPDAMYADGEGEGVSIRAFADCLLFGGAGHRTGVKGGGYKELADLAGEYYPGGRVAYRFAAQDCMSLDRIPYIGRYTKHSDHLYVATGFGKWGMTSAMVAAMLLRDQILERSNPYAEIFDPSRPMAKGALARNAGSVLMHYIRPTAPRCPHLGCALRWNEQERSWDCPCHGSRFSETGKLIDDPAEKDLNSSKVKK